MQRAKDKARTKPRDICERTFSFAVEIVTLCRKLEQADSAARVLARQLIRSGTSIGANVEEARGGQSRADFISKYAIAHKEARETHYWLRLLGATGIVTEETVSTLTQECNELIAILTAIIKKAQNKRDTSRMVNPIRTSPFVLCASHEATLHNQARAKKWEYRVFAVNKVG